MPFKGEPVKLTKQELQFKQQYILEFKERMKAEGWNRWKQ